MKVFCDTNVLIAASVETHIHHAPAKAILERICSGDDAGFVSAHSLVETFSVLSRMPTVPKLTPQDVLAILELLKHYCDLCCGLQDLSFSGQLRRVLLEGWLVSAFWHQKLEWVLYYSCELLV